MSALAGAAPPVGARGAEGPPPFRRRHSGPVALGPHRRRPSRRRGGARPGWCHRIRGHLPGPELSPTAVQHAGALSTPAHAKRAFALRPAREAEPVPSAWTEAHPRAQSLQSR
eukprot:scaffold8780_cov130-Isochrysis_galbana.AAC.5